MQTRSFSTPAASLLAGLALAIGAGPAVAQVDEILVTAQRREAGGETATIYRSRVGAGGRSLDPVLRTLLRHQHGDLLRDLHYLPGSGGA